MTDLKRHQIENRSREMRWRDAISRGDAGEAYRLSGEYRGAIDAQFEELSKLDSNSREYEQARNDLYMQCAVSSDLECKQRANLTSRQKERGYEDMHAQNMALHREMEKAIERADTVKYDSLKWRYQQNMQSHEALGKELERCGAKTLVDHVHEERVDVLNLDIGMRDRMQERISQCEANGRTSSRSDTEAFEKYSQLVRKDERELLEYQHAKEIEAMRDMGASEEYVRNRQEEQARFMERYDRFGY